MGKLEIAKKLANEKNYIFTKKKDKECEYLATHRKDPDRWCAFSNLETAINWLRIIKKD